MKFVKKFRKSPKQKQVDALFRSGTSSEQQQHLTVLAT